MVIYLRLFIYSLLSVSLLDLGMYATSTGLYGLKQTPCAWYERFCKSLLSVGYIQSMNDYVMFRRYTLQGLCFSFCMLMTWLLSGVIMLLLLL